MNDFIKLDEIEHKFKNEHKEAVMKLSQVVQDYMNLIGSKCTTRQLYACTLVLLIEHTSLCLGFHLSCVESEDGSDKDIQLKELLDSVLEAIRQSVIHLIETDK